MTLHRCVRGGSFAALLFGMAAPWGLAVDFNREVRPILNQHCTSCHGGVKQAGGISFIYREKALGKGKSGETPIVPGKPEASAMIRRVTSKDPEERMPPTTHGDGKPLAEREIATLRNWIAGGAAWGGHWSYSKPVSQPLPKVKNQSWARCGLDRFILAGLETERLKPSPEAARAQWLRRASFDLIGLPPEAEELEKFMGDSSPGAAEEAVERLLASRHFGERWAALWMDLARYADTQGYEKDNHRDMWPYRDWLIRAFNADLPFDQFTIKQLAGDLLPNASLDDRVATGFHRNTQTNTEGGTDDEEFRLLAVVDRINTTWTVWQATTFGCVQCHSHPYEAFAHEEYYRYLSFFNSTEDADLGDDFPRLKVPKDAERFPEAEALDTEIEQLREQLNAPGLPLAAAEHWGRAEIQEITGTKEARFIVNSNTDEVVVEGTVSNGAEYLMKLGATDFTALRMDILPRKNDPKLLPENGAVVSHLWLEVEPPPQAPEAAVEPGPSASTSSAGTAAIDGTAAAAATAAAAGSVKDAEKEKAPTEEDKDKEKEEKKPPPKPKRPRIEFAAVYADMLTGPFDPEESLKAGRDGGGAFPKLFGPRWLVFAAKTPVSVPAGASLRLHLKHDIQDAETKGSILYHFKLSTTRNPEWTALVNSPERADVRKRWGDARKRRESIASSSTLVMSERPSAGRRETRLFIRGNFLAKDKVVEPGLPAIFGAPGLERADRLGLARWLASADNPLTARVLVNRIWAELFGIGIVETVEDFGSTGQAPSHPELLDYLALRFEKEQGWSLKALLRELVLSATYRQDHRASPELLAKDPRNRLLARGPRTRLTAEMVRDQALLAGGLLSRRVGGPSVMPPQPDGVWQVVYNGAKWETPKDENKYRRGVYTYWRRTSPYPSFMTFDASSREVCTARRLVTNTPLQALVTMNDPVYYEAAQALGRRMQGEGGTDRTAQVAWVLRLITSGEPKNADVARLCRLYDDAWARYRLEPTLASKAGGTPEAAAATLVASTILNLDEALTK